MPSHASRLPYKNDPKQWGRGLPTTDKSEYLPKRYWLPAKDPMHRTCALAVDADPLFPDTRETFRLGNIGYAGVRIVNACLIGRREVGRDGLGRGGRVFAKLERWDEPRGGVLRPTMMGMGRGGLRYRRLGHCCGWTLEGGMIRLIDELR